MVHDALECDQSDLETSTDRCQCRHGADCNATNEASNTPLHLAAKQVSTLPPVAKQSIHRGVGFCRAGAAVTRGQR